MGPSVLEESNKDIRRDVQEGRVYIRFDPWLFA
jgi:hypothetical protein